MNRTQENKVNAWVAAIKDRYSYKGGVDVETETLESGNVFVCVCVNGVDVFDENIRYFFTVGKRGGVSQTNRNAVRTYVKSIFSLEKC